jgi:hypothetical protein
MRVEKDREKITLAFNILRKFKKNQMPKMMEVANLINRQSIIGHFFVHLGTRSFFVKKDISLDKGRLSKDELQRSILALSVNVRSFYRLIQKCMRPDGTANERMNDMWITMSYLHKECRPSYSSFYFDSLEDLKQKELEDQLCMGLEREKALEPEGKN